MDSTAQLARGWDLGFRRLPPCRTTCPAGEPPHPPASRVPHGHSNQPPAPAPAFVCECPVHTKDGETRTSSAWLPSS